MQQGDLVDCYENEILPRLNLELIYAPLNPVDKGRYYTANCPSCEKKGKAVIWKNTGLLECNKGGCKYKTDVFSYKNGGSYPSGRTWVDILKDLADQTGIQIPDMKWPEEDEAKHKEKIRKQNILQDFCRITTQALSSNEHPIGREYLKSRGLQEAQFSEYDLGYYPSSERIKEELSVLGYSVDEIEHSGVIRKDWDNRVVCPIRNLRRAIASYWARDTTNKAAGQYKCTYMSKKSGASLDVPFGLSDIDGHDIIAVEGGFDRLTLDAIGIKNVVSLGGRSLTDEHIQSFSQAKVRSVTLLMDNDQTGKEATIEIINKLVNNDLHVYVVPPQLLEDSKDPDEYARKHGKEAVQSLLYDRIDGFRYYAQSIVGKHKKGAEWKDHDRQEALDDARKLEEKVTNPNRLQSMDNFWQEFIQLTVIDQDIADKYRQDEQGKRHLATRNKLIEDSYKKTAALIFAGDFVAATAETHNLSRKLKEQEYSQDQALSEIMTPHSLNELFEAFQKEIPSIKTGYVITEDIPLAFPAGALSIIAGIPSGGKTTVLINTTIGALEQNPDLVAYFFSYEESAHHILAKFMNTYANVPLNKGNNRDAIYQFFHARGEESLGAFQFINQNKEPFRTKMHEFCDRYIATGRLKIIYSEMPAEKLINSIEYINQQNPNACMFVVDYIQQLETELSSSSIARYEELKNIAVMFRQCAARRGLAIVSGAQLQREVNEESKLHKNTIADCHGIAKEASIVYGLWNRSNNPAGHSDKGPAMFFQVLKGRNCREGDSSVMLFNGNTGKIGADAFVNDKTLTMYGTAKEYRSDLKINPSKDEESQPNFDRVMNQFQQRSPKNGKKA